MVLNQTAEAEITVIMIPQRARDGGIRAENKSSNGPLRAQAKNESAIRLVFCDVRAYVSCRGYVGIPQSARQLP